MSKLIGMEPRQSVGELEGTHKEGSSSQNEELIKREDIKDSPFQVVTTEEGSFGVMGKWRITELGTKEEIKGELEVISWNRIVQIIVLINDSFKK